MAAMEDGRPTDQSQFPRVGRPRKPPHEKRKKQQEATKWRDARRVYLGNSYDRWKKVKSRLGLKDCSLAWHLLEAHDSHCVECGRGADLGDEDDDTPRNFFPQLIKSIRRICLQYLTFQHTVEVVGLICLEIDKGTKENFSIKELVNRPIGLRVEALTSKQKSFENDSNIDVTNDDEDDYEDDNVEDDEDDMSDASNDESGTDVPDHKQSYEEGETGNFYLGVEHSKGGNSAPVIVTETITDQTDSEPTCDKSSSPDVSERREVSEPREDNSSLNVLPLTSMQDSPWSSSLRVITDTVQGGESLGEELGSNQGYNSPLDMAVVKTEQRPECGNFAVSSDDAPVVDSGLHAISQTIGRLVSSLPVTPTVDNASDQQTSPIDLKVVKQEPVDQLQHPVIDPPLTRPENPSPVHTPDNILSGKKRKFGCMEPVLNSHKKEVFHKEEYEVLEMTPFTDYAEFSRHCPTVLQRTFYRWKRRIKDEYIFLEQHPEMTYQEYLQYIPHAKENVFTFWKSLMKKGYLFGTGSTSHLTSLLSHKSDQEGRKSSPGPSNQLWDEENSGHQVLKHMQKNLTAEYQDVLKHFPTLPEHVFKIWKQKNLQAWKFLEQNFTLEYSVFSRCFPTVSEEVFNIWRQSVLRDSRTKILNLQREAVSTAEHIQEAQKALWTSLISQRLAQEHSRFTANPTSWPGLAGGWLGEYPGFWGTALNLSTLSRMDQSQIAQLQREVPHTENAKTASSSSSVNSDTSARTETSVSFPSAKNKLEDDSDATFLSKSKKQNKAEFYHYLQNPDMDYTDISKNHPSVSLRTFYRWKKEIKTALAYVQDVSECSYSAFHSYFPDIPEEIYLQWTKKIKEPASSAQELSVDSQLETPARPVIEKQELIDSDREPDVDAVEEEELRDENLNMKGDERSSRKVNLQEFLYLQQNPTIDFAGFTYQFPHISMRTFYRWRREIQDQINAIRRSPNISLSDLQRMYPEVSEQVLSVWKKVVKSERELMNGFDSQECDQESVNLSTQNKENMSHDINHMDPALLVGQSKKLKLSSNQDHSAAESNKKPRNVDETNTSNCSPKTTGRTLMKTGRQEYCFLMQNPEIDLHSFLRMFPDMSPATFYRWRREMKAILDYMSSHPDAGYQDVVAEFPEVSQDMFTQWREKLKKPSEPPGSPEQNPIKRLQALVNDGETYATKQDYHGEPGFVFLLENPSTSIVEFSKMYPSVSAGTFSRWKKLVKDWFTLLKVSVDIDYQTFSFYCSEVPEHIFNKWKILVQKKEGPLSDENDAEGFPSGNSVNSPEDWVLTKTRKVNQTEYLFFLMNPYMDYNEFAVTFPLISLRTFYRWRREIRESLEYLEQYPDVSFKAFFQVFPVVPEEVFNKWKELCAEQNRKVEVNSESLKRSLNYNISDPESMSNKTEDLGPASCADSDEGQGKSAAKTNLGLPVNKTLNMEEESMFSVDSPDPPGIVSSLSSSESLSAAVESICRSAGLPPLDQAVDDIAKSQTVVSASSSAGSSVLGGVAFPGMSAAQSRTLPSNLDSSSNIPTQIVKQEEVYDEPTLSGKQDSYGSTTPPATSTSMGGIAFPGLSSVPPYMDSPAGLASQMMKEESFFSPRARKQSREEYLFLQQNPNMDFQEFCSHYPTISLRTFYRWKREFRQSHEYMMGLHSSLQ